MSLLLNENVTVSLFLDSRKLFVLRHQTLEIIFLHFIFLFKEHFWQCSWDKREKQNQSPVVMCVCSLLFGVCVHISSDFNSTFEMTIARVIIRHIFSLFRCFRQ